MFTSFSLKRTSCGRFFALLLLAVFRHIRDVIAVKITQFLARTSSVSFDQLYVAARAEGELP